MEDADVTRIYADWGRGCNADLRGWRTRIYADGICFFHGVDAKNVGATGTSPHVAEISIGPWWLTRIYADGGRGFTRIGDADVTRIYADWGRGCNADLRGWRTRIYADGICFFHGVDAKNVGATGTSPHVAEISIGPWWLTRIYADGGRGFTRIGDADVTRIYADGGRGFTRMGYFFHGVDAKNVGATGTSPHVAEISIGPWWLTRIYADWGRGCNAVGDAD
jgi:hypothetical protein